MKTILYGHAWMSGALTGFAFFGLARVFGITWQVWPWQVWASVVAVGLLWTLLGFSYVACRDWADGDDSEEPAPAPGAGRPAEGGAGPSRPRAAPSRYVAPLLMLAVFWAVAVLLTVAVKDLWSRNTGQPPARPSTTPNTGGARPLPPPGGG